MRNRIYPDLRTWRTETGISQEDAARKLGVSSSYLSRLERKLRGCNGRLAKRISERTGVPLESVLGL